MPSSALQYDGNHFDGAVLPGRPQPPPDLDHAEVMRLAAAQPAEPLSEREPCELLLLISSAAGYERRRKAVRETYLSLLRDEASSVGVAVRYRFLLGAPREEQKAVLEAEQAQHGDLLQVSVPESYETLWPKVVAAWRWAVATHDFHFWMHADDDSFLRLELLLKWLRAQRPDANPAAAAPSAADPLADDPAARDPSTGGPTAADPSDRSAYDPAGGRYARGLYAGYIWDGSEGRRTRPLRDPTAKSFVPVEQWPEDSYPPFASGCGFILSRDLVERLVAISHNLTFFRVIDVPVGIALSRLPPQQGAAPLRIVHMDQVRPYRPLPLFRAETLVQHYMQPEEFRHFFESAYGPQERSAEEARSDAAIAQVYDLFVRAKVMRR